MKSRTIVTAALAVFILATAAYFVFDEVRTGSAVRRAEEDRAAGATRPDQDVSSPALSQNSAGPPGAAATASVRLEPSDSVPTGPAAPGPEKGGPSLPPDSQAVPPQPSGLRRSDAPSTEKTLAYYFHGTQRCPTCMKLEAYSAEAIRTGFVDALRQGRLEWRVVNVDEPANKHFVDDYKLYTKALVVVKLRDGRGVEWKNLEKIWDLVGEKDEFIKYVQEEVSAFVGDGT